MFDNSVTLALGLVLGLILAAVITRILRARKQRAFIKNAEKLATAKGLVLKPGWAHNPALKYPPNHPCFCGSGAKFKRCCLEKLPRYVRETALPSINAELKATMFFVEKNMDQLR